MAIVDLLRRALKSCADVLKLGAGIQEPARRQLIQDLQSICKKCEQAYATVLKRLSPVKDSLKNPQKLAFALRQFASDTRTRNAFKPEHLCGEVDHLLARLQSNLDPLKYSVDVSRIQEIRGELSTIGNVDAAIYRGYDELTAQLDDLATQLQTSTGDRRERTRYIRHVIANFEQDLRGAIAGIRKAKSAIVPL